MNPATDPVARNQPKSLENHIKSTKKILITMESLQNGPNPHNCLRWYRLKFSLDLN